MTEETKKKIASLESTLTPRGAYEALKFGYFGEGKKFLDVYVEIRKLEGSRVWIEATDASSEVHIEEPQA